MTINHNNNNNTTFATLATVLLLVVASAEKEHKQLRRARQRALWSRGTSFCYEDQNNPGDAFDPCWENRPSYDLTPECALTSGTKTCRCNGEFCDVHVGTDSNDFEAAYCSDVTCYVPSVNERDTQCFCKNTVRLPAFPRRGNRATEKCTGSWWKWGCCLFTSGYTWKDGKCQDKTRFMNEKCWDGGRCKSGDGDDGRVSCYQSKCQPWVSTGKRPQCECNWFDWNFFFACSSSTCDGHACVWNTGNGNRYCDYGSNPTW